MKLLSRLLGMGLICVPAFCVAAVAKLASGEPVARQVQHQVKRADPVKQTARASTLPRAQTVSPRPTLRPVAAPRAPVLAPAARRSGVASGSGLMPGVLGGPAAPSAKNTGVVQGTGMKHRR